MSKFEQSFIWIKNLADQSEPDQFKNERELLRVEFRNFRDKAKTLAAEIASKLPDFTVHDITHIDALWDMADIFLPEDYQINPAETFVLGGAFLLHDLGMALAAYPNGIKSLQNEQIWKDTHSAALKNPKGIITQENISDFTKNAHKIANETTLRLLHAQKASELAKISWKDKNGLSIYLIDNDELRNSLGNIIGLIAYSHWWRVDELEDKLPPTLGALSKFPIEWTIDPLKIACILRLADAIHIDDRRAPYFLRILRKPSTPSDLHWEFQEKLCKPQIKYNKILFTTKSPFSASEMESWWLCYDTLKMIDKELREVDELLCSKDYSPFKAIGVASIDNIKILSKAISVEEWTPVDTQIKVNNVAKLVNNLGGEALYGKNIIVPLRELIQNASDAIRARRTIDNENPEFGDIFIRYEDSLDNSYIEVEDNGIGMSSNVLTGPFLDFGQSFWGTELMHAELPGLESKGFISTGKYGIGFFSLFMWGTKITVATNRYNKGREETLVLEFNNGVNSRPVLRKASNAEIIRNGVTKVRIWMNQNIIHELRTKYTNDNDGTFKEIIEQLCPSIDCNIYLIENDKKIQIIKANDWIDMPAKDLIKRLVGTQKYTIFVNEYKDIFNRMCENMEVIKDYKELPVGRVTLNLSGKMPNSTCIVTVGGFRTSTFDHISGVLIGESYKASRDVGIPTISTHNIQAWTQRQIDKYMNNALSDDNQLYIAHTVWALGGNTQSLNIAFNNKYKTISYAELIDLIESFKDDYFLIVSMSELFNEQKTINKIHTVELNSNVVMTIFGILPLWIDMGRGFAQWPPAIERPHIPSILAQSLEGLIIEAAAQVWNCDLAMIYRDSKIINNIGKIPTAVGKLDGEEFVMKHGVYTIRKPSKLY